MATQNDIALAHKMEQDKMNFKNEVLREVSNTDLPCKLALVLVQFITVKIQNQLIRKADRELIYRKNYFEEENYELEQALHVFEKYLNCYYDL